MTSNDFSAFSIQFAEAPWHLLVAPQGALAPTMKIMALEDKD